MVDYDVAAIGLDVPPAAAYKTTYRPAILVRNNGKHPATVTGNVSILNLDTGLQVFYSPVHLANLAAGSDGSALADVQVTFDTEGNYIAFGFVTTDHDSVPSNNYLNPTKFKVGPGTPPVPVVVPAHAPQHELTGSDKLDVEGLVGKLADPQEPDEHVASHQVGGSDQINLDGLSGEAASPQPAKAHGNEAHTPDMATADQMSGHIDATAVHTAATNLANRETSGGNQGLVVRNQLSNRSVVLPAGDKYLRFDQYWHTPVPDYSVVIWDSTNPTPDGWAIIIFNPTPQAPMVYIQKLPTP